MQLAALLKHDRAVVAGALTLVVAISLGYLFTGAGMDAAFGTLQYATFMFLMWWVMMAAMMLPSAASVLLLVAALNRRARPDRLPYGSTGSFAAGYLLVWAGFSVAAVATQWWLARSGLLSESMHAMSPVLAGALLAAAGLWQLTPAKHACLAHCRSPLRFLVEHRRTGDHGGVVTGIEHGAYCLGCCWLLMTLLFVGGVMNFYWILGLSAYVATEKLLPAGIASAAGPASPCWLRGSR